MEKQRAATSRSNELTDSVESSRAEANLKLSNPHPDSELTYSQQIKEQDKTVNAANKSLEPGEQAVSKSSEPEKSGELAANTSRPSREDETSQEAKEKRNLLKKLTASLSQSASRQPNRLPAFGSGRRRNMARYKRRPGGEHKRVKLARCRSTTPDSDDELSNHQVDFSSSFKRRDATKPGERNRDFAFKVLDEQAGKSKKKRPADLEELVQRALIKNNSFKFNDCNISLHFG